MSLARTSNFLRSQFSRLPYPEYSFAGQTVIVTGANTGLGYEAANHYVRLGVEKLIIAVRSLEKGEEAKRKIEERTCRSGAIEVWQLDLSSYESVKSFVKKAESLPRIDILLANAAVISGSWQTAEGSELTITVNVYGTFLLVLLMFPLLRKSSSRHNTHSKLTVVTSDTHHMTDFKEAEQDDIPATLDDPKNFDVGSRYPISKLLEIYHVRAFCSKVNPHSTGVTMNMVNPGLCWSELGRNASWTDQLRLYIMRTLVARTTEVGSRTLVYATTGGIESHGMYSTDCEFVDRAVRKFIRSEEGKKVQEKVYEQISRKLESIQPGIFANIPLS